MRTKTLLLTAILSAAGMASSFAQGVYSVNVVGYVTVTITNSGKYTILANPLITTNNSLSVLIPNPPLGSQVLKLTPTGTYQGATFTDDTEPPSWTTDLQLPLGQGFFYRLPFAAPSATITFVGEVAQREASNKEIPGAFTNSVRYLSLQGSMVPQAGGIISVHNVPAGVGDQILKLLPTGGYQAATFSDDFEPPQWTADLQINVAEGFFTRYAAPVQWNRNFVVPTP